MLDAYLDIERLRAGDALAVEWDVPAECMAERVPVLLLQPLGMVSLMLTTYTMGALGMDGEMQRSGGFDVA